jgi:hypothetical protein
MNKPGRRPRATPVVVEDNINHEVLAADASKLPAFTAQTAEVMDRIGYDVPYNRERVVQEARFYMGTAAEAMLEAGKRLILLKEHEPHGDFVEIIERDLGMVPRTAQRLMSAAVKYLLNPALESKATALSLLGKTKLLELVSESDDDLAALADGGTLAGLTLDEIDRMTSRELKVALREAHAEAEANAGLLSAKNEKIDKLLAEKKRIKRTTPDEVLRETQAELNSVALTAHSYLIGDLRQGIQTLAEHHEANGGDSNVVLAGIVGQLQADINALREEFGIPDVTPSMIPEWVSQA